MWTLICDKHKDRVSTFGLVSSSTRIRVSTEFSKVTVMLTFFPLYPVVVLSLLEISVNIYILSFNGAENPFGTIHKSNRNLSVNSNGYLLFYYTQIPRSGVWVGRGIPYHVTYPVTYLMLPAP